MHMHHSGTSTHKLRGTTESGNPVRKKKKKLTKSMDTQFVINRDVIYYHSGCVSVHLDHRLHRTISWHCWGGNIYGEIPAIRKTQPEKNN